MILFSLRIHKHSIKISLTEVGKFLPLKARNLDKMAMKLITSFRTPALWLPVAFPSCSHPNLTLLFRVPTTCPEFFKRTSMGDRTVIEKFHKKKTKNIYLGKS